MSKGRLIVVEGPDGAGKSGISRLLATALRLRGEQVVEYGFPGNEPGSLGHLVYQVHHSPATFGIAAVNPTSLQALHVAAHLDAIDRVIRPSIERGLSVVLDRYWWSTWVYGVDGNARLETLRLVIEAERAHWGTLLPEAVILVARKDSLKKEESGDLWTRRTNLYQSLASQETAYPVHVIANDSTEEAAVERALSFLPSRTAGSGL